MCGYDDTVPFTSVLTRKGAGKNPSPGWERVAGGRMRGASVAWECSAHRMGKVMRP